MSELSELYHQVILDHNRSPRNFRQLEDGNREAEGYNPLCGDHLFLYLRVEDDVIQDIGFQGSGCAISKSSASLMSESVKGKTRDEAQVLFERFHDLVTGDGDTALAGTELGKLRIFSGVREFPTRVKCAILPWHTLRGALDDKAETVSTE